MSVLMSVGVPSKDLPNFCDKEHTPSLWGNGIFWRGIKNLSESSFIVEVLQGCKARYCGRPRNCLHHFQKHISIMEATIINSYTVAEFKELMGLDSINIIRNPKTGLLFTEIEGLLVAREIDLAKPLGVVQFEDEIYCICNTANNLVVSL